MSKLFISKRIILLLIISFFVTNHYNYGEVVGSNDETAPSFLVYYGVLDEMSAKRVASYDIAILEPKGTTPTINETISSNDTLVFGYLSTLGVEGYDAFKIDHMNEDDYLYVDGKKAYIESFDNYIGDIRSPHFRELLFTVLEETIIDQGYQGVFLDTVDFTEYFDDNVLNTSLQEGYIEFLEELEERYPDLLIFQNRGFKSYLLGAAKSIDYLLYENFDADRIINSRYYENLVEELSGLSKRMGGQICGVSFSDERSNASLADDLGWSFHYSSLTSNYVVLPEIMDQYFAAENGITLNKNSY